MEDRIFKYALIISLILHLGFFVRLSYQSIVFPEKIIKETEIVYPQLMVLETALVDQKIPLRGMKVDIETQRIESSQESASFVKDISKMTEDFFHKVQKSKHADEQRVKRKVAIPMMEAPEIKNPLYNDYYQQVRARIRERAYANFKELESGEVYLTFIIDSSGTLRVIRIVQERTRANYYLQNISRKSIEEASPFLPFPSDLEYPELSFNVVISFKVE